MLLLKKYFLPQEEDLQEIITKISSKRDEYEEARTQMTDHKASYEKAEREYKQHKERINTIAEEADSIKVLKGFKIMKKSFFSVYSKRVTLHYFLIKVRGSVSQSFGE